MRVPIGAAGREEFLAGVHAGVLSTVVGTAGRMLAVSVRYSYQPGGRWGATKDEVGRPMPGDGILGPGTGFTTRAVTIRAPTDQVWPWLTQLGYGRAGWYSYDWLDNDGRRSAEQAGPHRRARRIRRTLASLTRWPSRHSSPCTLRYPHAGFSRASRRTRSRTSGVPP